MDQLLCNEKVNINECDNNYLQIDNNTTNLTITQNSFGLGNNRPVNKAKRDPIFLDDRCLENLLKSEDNSYRKPISYFNSVQKDVTPAMRKMVAQWIIEVCKFFFFIFFNFYFTFDCIIR